MLDICLAGTGGMMPLPYRFLTSLMLRYEGSQLLIDCGEGTQIALKKRGWSFKPIDIICITHFHADHISGLVGLLLSMGNAERTEPVTMIGPKGLAHVVDSLRVVAPELPFSIEFIELSEPFAAITIRDYVITAYRVHHAIPTYGYAVEIPRAGRFQVERAQALGLPVRLWNRLQRGETVDYEGAVYYPEMVMGPPRRGLKVAYCTDSRPTRSIIEGARNADLFICEGMYGEPGSEARAAEHKHMSFAEAAQLAEAAGVRELWLTHFSPALNHPEEFAWVAREIFPNVRTGTDGMSKSLRFEEE